MPEYQKISIVFDGPVTFAHNGDPTYATFDVHIRYGNDCSGWVSDGYTTSDTSETTTCRSVPEPGSLALLGLGLIGLGFARRRTTIAS